MDSLRARFRSLAWIALTAILLGVVAPVISTWLHASSPSGQVWLEVCSASTGAKSGPATPSQDQIQKSHCPFCLPHAQHLSLPPVEQIALIRTDLAMGTPDLFLQSPRTLFIWAAAQARAPPIQA